jgi:hypothetical protein
VTGTLGPPEPHFLSPQKGHLPQFSSSKLTSGDILCSAEASHRKRHVQKGADHVRFECSC